VWLSHPLQITGFSRQTPHKTEPEVVELIAVGGVSVAEGRPAVIRVVAPATAAINPVRIGASRASRVGLTTRTIIIIPVTTPFEHIPAHIIQPEFIR